MKIHGRLALGLVLGASLAAPSLARLVEDPTKLVGTWAWKWKDAKGETHRHVLKLDAVGGKLTGLERFDDKPGVKVDDLKVEGDVIGFTVTREGRYAEYKGKVASPETINGDVTVMQDGVSNKFGWTASREAEVK